MQRFDQLGSVQGDKASDLKLGLATEWHIDPTNHKRWIFTLRQGVKWHDGCDFTADDVARNFQRISDPKAPQFFTLQFALSRANLTNFDSVERLECDALRPPQPSVSLAERRVLEQALRAADCMPGNRSLV